MGEIATAPDQPAIPGISPQNGNRRVSAPLRLCISAFFPYSYKRGITRRWFCLLLLCLLLASGCTFLAPAPTPTIAPTPAHTTAMQQADDLFTAGRYYEAHQRYLQLTQNHPDTADLLLRLGMSYTLRGEYSPAEGKLRRALWLGMPAEPTHLALLYLSYLLRERELIEEAGHTWARTGGESPLDGVAYVLQGESALRQGNYRAAETAYRDATRETLPADWLPTVAYRLALLRAAHSADTARQDLTTFQATYAAWEKTDNTFPQEPFTATTAADPFLTPLLPDIRQPAAQLLAILQTDDPERQQLLGQYYLQHAWYGLAEDQFASIPADSPQGLNAQAYTAYTRWKAGDKQAALTQLQQLAEEHPEEPRAGLLLTLAYLAEGKPAQAQAQIDQLAQRHPQMPDVALSRANLHTAQSDYVSASTAYQEALKNAPNSRRGSIALLAARFYFEHGYNTCSAGLPAAEYAAPRLPDDPRAWTTLAALRYQCDEFAGAIQAASRAREHGATAEATYYRGAALLATQQYREARNTLILAADRQPASIWRERAEEKLALLR